MAYIIVDLEFNNMKDITKYYKDFYENNKEIEDIKIENEIIEIGAVKFDEHMKCIASMKEYIKPSIFPIINPAVSEITKIDMKLLDSKGISFERGLLKLKEMFDDGDVLCSWAKDDIIELIVNAEYYKCKDTGFIQRYLDLQEYATKILGYKKSLGLKKVITELKIKVDEEKLHDAFYDAQYTGEVFKRIYNSRIIKNYIVDDIYNMPALNMDNLEEFLINRENLKLECPKCKKKIDEKTDIKLLKWRFATVGLCPKCKNNILCEVTIKKSFKGDIYYNEISSVITSEAFEDYCYKLKDK